MSEKNRELWRTSEKAFLKSIDTRGFRLIFAPVI